MANNTPTGPIVKLSNKSVNYLKWRLEATLHEHNEVRNSSLQL